MQDPEGNVIDFRYSSNPEDSLHLYWNGEGYVVRREYSELEPRLASLRGEVGTSLYQAIRDLGEKPQLANSFADVFAWDLDFTRNSNAGDSFHILYEKLYRTDDDGLEDSAEDLNCNGAVDPGDTDPSGDPSVLRNDLTRFLSTAPMLRAAIFSGIGPNTLVLAGHHLGPEPGEGADPTANGSGDDDDCYDRLVTTPWTDPDALVPDTSRPLVYYQSTTPGNILTMVKDGDSVRLDW